MQDFPGNSHNPLGDNKKKEPEVKKKEVVKIVAVDATLKPIPIHKKIKGIFFSGSARSASQFVFRDVLIPALKHMIAEGTSKGIDKMLYGESPRSRFGNSEISRSRFSYNNPIYRGDPRERVMFPDQPPRAITRHAPVGDIILTTRIDAENVIEELAKMIERYEVASVADLYELVGLPSAHTDNKWGWAQLKYANVRQTRDGYLIELPPAEAI